MYSGLGPVNLKGKGKYFILFTLELLMHIQIFGDVLLVVEFEFVALLPTSHLDAVASHLVFFLLPFFRDHEVERYFLHVPAVLA